MSTITDKQSSFIQSLCAERAVALSSTHAYLLQQPLESTRDASNLITALKAVPRDPQPVDVDQQARIDALKGNLENLSDSDRRFAVSLAQQFDERGRLSDKQWVHVDRLGQPAVAPSCNPQQGDIVFANGEYYIIRLSKQGRPYAKRMVDGKWEYDREGIHTARTGEILTGDALAEWASNHGHTYGQCVFCFLELTDERSVDVGYGQICAGKHNLPWG